jgi:small-conductance mechanosensitive channel
MAGAPMPALQKRAWGGLVSGLGTLGIIMAILFNRDAAEYWENDDLRLLVVGIFIGGLLLHAAVSILPLVREERESGIDERDRSVLGRAATTQSALVLLGLAAWVLYLARRFHDQGVVPVVYLYLIFGSIILVNQIGQSLGILIGYWRGVASGQG